MRTHIVNILLRAPLVIFVIALMVLLGGVAALMFAQSEHPWLLGATVVFVVWFGVSALILIDRDYRRNPDG